VRFVADKVALIEPIRVIIRRFTAKLFAHFPSHSNPLVQQIGTYILAEFTNMYRKHKREHTAIISLPGVAVCVCVCVCVRACVRVCVCVF